jgi:hypothetical protein
LHAQAISDAAAKLRAAHEKAASDLGNAQAEHERKLNEANDKARHQLETVTWEKDQEINRLRVRMASYSTNNYTAIPDPTFSHAMSDVSSSLINLCNRVQRKDGLVVTSTLDPTGFWARQGTVARNWAKFVRHLCWNALLRGFFSYPLGFGAFGYDSEGHDALAGEYQLFMGGDPEGKQTLSYGNAHGRHQD